MPTGKNYRCKESVYICEIIHPTTTCCQPFLNSRLMVRTTALPRREVLNIENWVSLVHMESLSECQSHPSTGLYSGHPCGLSETGKLEYQKSSTKESHSQTRSKRD